jgi:hypothetical protein
MRRLTLVLALAVMGCGGGCSGSSKISSGTAGTTGMSGTAGTGSGGSTGAGGQVLASSGCPTFTPDDPWNADVTNRAVNTTMTNGWNALYAGSNLHPDFTGPYGIPINVVPANQPKVSVVWEVYADESDPGPYPLPGPSTVKLEGTTDATSCDGDCHLLVVQQGTCQLFEGWQCLYHSDGWHCSNGAKWDLTKYSTGQRPDGWTSADAAGLSIYAGLARYEEAMAGEITHAIRFTLPCSSDARVPPATHQAPACASSNTLPMGARIRMKASYDISGFGPVAQTFLRAFKKYGLILADNGSAIYFQSEENANWPDEVNDLKRVPGSAFEVVNP